MTTRFQAPDPDQALHRALAEFRHQLRKFLVASENAAHQAGLHPQQHQLLLAVAGVAPGTSPSIAHAAEQLGLKHNSVVELVDRCEKESLLERTTDPADGRRVCLRITARGKKVLARLSQVHLQELYSQAPHLIEALQTVLQNDFQATPEPVAARK
jgi:DNA-binding MarR family transcriptional regulator